MHPAEKELVLGALEQIEASCRTLRRYLAFSVRAQPAAEMHSPLSPPSDDVDERGETLEGMLGRMMMGGLDEPRAV